MIKIMVCGDINNISPDLNERILSDSSLEITHTVSSPDELVYLAIRDNPDVILMDISTMNDHPKCVPQISAAEKILSARPNIKIIITSDTESDSFVYDAYLAGVVGYIIKPVGSNYIIKTIKNANKSEFFMDTYMQAKVKQKVRHSLRAEESMMFFINKLSNLTAMEMKILKHLYSGAKRREIAEKEYLSEETVKHHITHILKKLDFRSTKCMIGHLNELGIMEMFDDV